jgi:hypothetical protein
VRWLRLKNSVFVGRKYATAHICVTALYGNDDTVLAYIELDSKQELKKDPDNYMLVTIGMGKRVDSIPTIRRVCTGMVQET